MAAVTSKVATVASSAIKPIVSSTSKPTAPYVAVFEDLKRILPFFKWHQHPEGTYVLYRDGEYFTPLTALCYHFEGKFYYSLEYMYAASEMNLDPSLAYKIETQNDNAEGIFYDELKKIFVEPRKAA